MSHDDGVLVRWSRALPPWAWGLAVAQWLPILVKAVRNSAEPTDFYVFHAAASRLLAGESVYGPDYAYFYPPLFAYLMTPYAWVPVRAAAIWWAFLQVPCFYYAASRFLPEASRVGRARPWILAFSPLLVFRFIDSDVVNGNCNVVLLALLAGMVHLLRHERAVWAGGVLAVVGAIKLSPLYLVPTLAIAGRWRAAVAATLIFPVVFAVPFWLQSQEIERSGNHLQEVLRIVLTVAERDDDESRAAHLPPLPPTPEELDGYVPGQSLRPILHRWLRATDATAHDKRTVRLNVVDLAPQTVEWIYRGGAFALALGVLFLMRGTSLRWAIATGLTALLLISPYSRKAHFVFLLPALFLLLELGWTAWRHPAKVALLVSWSLGQLSARAFLGKTWSKLAVGAGAPFFSAVVVLVGLCWIRRAERIEPESARDGRDGTDGRSRARAR
ncbi:MAG: glycosyltransferase family 87 protein [Planctomycetota bacterium]